MLRQRSFVGVKETLQCPHCTLMETHFHTANSSAREQRGSSAAPGAVDGAAITRCSTALSSVPSHSTGSQPRATSAGGEEIFAAAADGKGPGWERALGAAWNVFLKRKIYIY